MSSSAAESAGELLDVSEPAEQSPHDSQVDAWDAATGSFLKGFPQVMDSLQFFDQPLVADLAGSRGNAYAVEVSSDSDLRAFDAAGHEAPGFPKLTGGWVTGGAVFGPLGSMPDQVLVAGTREGELFVWQTAAPASGPRGAWPQVHQNLWNTNDYSGGAMPSDGTTSSGGAGMTASCRQSRSGGAVSSSRREATDTAGPGAPSNARARTSGSAPPSVCPTRRKAESTGPLSPHPVAHRLTRPHSTRSTGPG